MEKKKARSRQLLAERYYGKRDILATYEEMNIPKTSYLKDLKRRVRSHHNDLAYRGVIEIE